MSAIILVDLLTCAYRGKGCSGDRKKRQMLTQRPLPRPPPPQHFDFEPSSKSSAMASDLPYAADAQVSLSYDELEVRLLPLLSCSQHSALAHRSYDCSTRKNARSRTSPFRPNSTTHGAS